MDNHKLQNALNQFLGKNVVVEDKGEYQEVCDLQTGDCYTIRTKDGLIERLDKKFITEDGRTLLRG
jgi:hypothetical protein